jgi:hypothetical protein
MEAICKQELRNKIEVVALGDVQVEFQVFAAIGPSRRQGRIIAPHLLNAASPHQRCAAGQEVSSDQSGIDISAKSARRYIEEHPVLFIDGPRPAIDQSNVICATPRNLQLLLDLFRMPKVVSVQGSNKLSLCMCNSAVASRHEAAVGLSEKLDPVVQVRHTLDQGGRLVGRTVVNDQHFQI